MGLIDKLLDAMGIVHNKKFHCKIGNVRASRFGPLPLEDYSVDSFSIKLKDSRYKVSCPKMRLEENYEEDSMFGCVVDCAGTCLESPRFPLRDYNQKQMHEILELNNYHHKWCPYLELSELASQDNQTAKIK